MRTTSLGLMILLALIPPFVLSNCGGGVPYKPQMDTQGLDVFSEAEIDGFGYEIEEYKEVEIENQEYEEEWQGEDISKEVGPGEPHWPCTENSECQSGYCIETPQGKECAAPCGAGSACQMGLECVQVGSGSDIVYICVHPAPKVCSPCKTDDDCKSTFASKAMSCVMIEGYAFCLMECSEGEACPEGSQCVGQNGRNKGVCIPDKGICDCSSKSIKDGIKGACEITNNEGTCIGEYVCGSDGVTECTGTPPSVEVCNNIDDDCDGLIDENIGGEPCDLSNSYGTCKGKAECIGGKLVCQGSYPSPEVCNGIDDNCNGKTDEGYSDNDLDGVADCVDKDDDGDGVDDDLDNCPLVNNPSQEDTDKDKEGDACDLDDDQDMIMDEFDNCPLVKNPNQEDKDGDGVGDACDDDSDGDGVPDQLDNCPYVPNIGQQDLDGDKIGDACDADKDGDNVLNSNDNCPDVKNGDQKDNDGDGMGDICDNDDDNDLIDDEKDNCPFNSNGDQQDLDEDGLGDVCDDDKDGDNIENGKDNCPGLYNPD